MTGTEVAVRKPQASVLPAKIQYARALADSGLLPESYRRQPANVLWAMEYADMLGLPPMAAMTGVHVIKGRPTASAGLISALVRRAGHKLRVRGDARSATCEIVRADDPEYTFSVTFTMDDAKRANLTGKDVWKEYGPSMLKARAITQCARDACEEALFGLHYTAEELGAEVDEDGTVVGEVVDDSASAGPVQQAAADPANDNEFWYANPSPEQEWLVAAIEAAPERDLKDAVADWQKLTGYVNDGKLTREEGGRLQPALRKRIKELKAAEATAEPPCEDEAIEGHVVTLDPADPWAQKVEELVTEDDAFAALSELADQLNDDQIDGERFRQVEAAIAAKFPAVSGEGQAAA